MLVDAARTLVPTSGTVIRSDPYAYRGWMDPLVYASLIERVVFVGTESTGKSTLARRMAEQLGTLWTHEFGRELWEAQGGQGTFADHLKLARRQRQREDAAARHSRRFLFCDTNAWSTLHWSLRSYGTADARLHDLVDRTVGDYRWFLCDNDFGWVRDGTRELEGAAAEQFQRQHVEDLERRGIPYVTLSGPSRTVCGRSSRRSGSREVPHVPGAPLASRRPVGQYGGTGRRLERRERRQPFAEPGSAGRERKAARSVRRRLYLMRHADVSYVDESGAPVNPETVPLTPRGREQAAAAREALAEVGFDLVLASDLPRTAETAGIVAPGLEVERWPELAEWRGGRLDALPPDELESLFVGALRVTDEAARFLGGESLGEALDRVHPALDRLVERDWDTALAVLHGGVNRIVISYALSGDRTYFGTFEQAPACINVLDLGDDGWIVRTVNYIPYDPLHPARETTMEHLWEQLKPFLDERQ